MVIKAIVCYSLGGINYTERGVFMCSGVFFCTKKPVETGCSCVYSLLKE